MSQAKRDSERHSLAEREAREAWEQMGSEGEYDRVLWLEVGAIRADIILARRMPNVLDGPPALSESQKATETREIGGSGRKTSLPAECRPVLTPFVVPTRPIRRGPGTAKLGKVMFGDVSMFRVYCPVCDEVSLCGEPDQCDKGHELDTPRKQWREALGSYVRKKPSFDRQKEIMLEQGDRCMWCLRDFGSAVELEERLVYLTVEWDHFTPFAFTGSCADDAFVASCQVCNRIKGSLIFDTIDEARDHVMRELQAQRIYGIPGAPRLEVIDR